MSDEHFEGRSLFCIPRRYFVVALALCVWLRGALSLVYLIFLKELPGEEGSAAQQRESHCVGHSCRQILTCGGTRAATFHTREVITLFSNMLFGYWGVLGTMYGYMNDTVWFATYLSLFPLLLGSVFAADGAYTLICGAYPLNVVDEALLWHVPNFPIQEAMKIELRDAMIKYPVRFTNKLVERNVFLYYAVVELAVAAFIAYCSKQVFAHAQFTHHGLLGLGATYDIGEWRQRLALRSGRKALAEGGYGGTGGGGPGEA